MCIGILKNNSLCCIINAQQCCYCICYSSSQNNCTCNNNDVYQTVNESNAIKIFQLFYIIKIWKIDSGGFGVRHLQVFILFLGMMINYALRVSFSLALVVMAPVNKGNETTTATETRSDDYEVKLVET